LIRRKLAGDDALISVGTIHRQQGTEQEVVIMDLVNGASAFSSAEIRMMVNVAMSRAKRHLIVIASKAELRSPVLRPLATLLKPSIRKKIDQKAPGFEGLLNLIRPSSAGKEAQRLAAAIEEMGNTLPRKEAFLTPRNWGHDIAQLRNRRPLFSAEQVRLIEKNVGEGHRLVRGVAGRGKSLILTAWAAKMIQANPTHRVLITYFNKGMKILLRLMIEMAAGELSGGNPDRILRQVMIAHFASVARAKSTDFDAVFVDESQDMDGDTLRDLYDRCRPTAKGFRNFVHFADDSQNIYGKKTLEELRGILPEGLDFRGRSDVLRETYRSTQTILSLAVNLALDPKNVYERGAPRLLEYMRVRELAQEGLLIRPEDSPDGAYSVCYTEREGVGTRIFKTSSRLATLEALGKEIRRLVAEEGLALGDFMVITVKQPDRVAKALNAAGINAKAFGGAQGEDTLGMPGAGGDFVRCTTVFTSKGHESPIGVFLWPEELEEIEDFMKIPGATEEDFERIRRCMLYVSVSRAMFIQYVFGAESRFMKAADVYRRADSGRTPAWT
jgi:superfamily I DNA and RNA helicase